LFYYISLFCFAVILFEMLLFLDAKSPVNSYGLSKHFILKVSF